MLPVLGYWASQLRVGTARVESWLPHHSAAIAKYADFVKAFGDDQFLIISWPDCRLDDPRLVDLARLLESAAENNPSLAIEEVQNSLSAIESLANSDAGISPDEASRRLEGRAIGADGTCFLTLRLADADAASRGELLAMIQVSAERAGVPPNSLIMAGEPLQVSTIDRASRETVRYFVAPSSILALAVAFCCLRSVGLTLLVFVFAGIGQLLGLATISLFLGEMSAVLVVLPTLVFMLTLSAAIHLTSYYVEANRCGTACAGVAALRVGIKPCLLATLTTVFGFGSLAVSQLEPVWQFGCLAALGLILSTVVLLLCFPSASTVATLPLLSPKDRGLAGVGVSQSAEASQTTAPSLWKRKLAEWSKRHNLVVTLAGLSLLCFALLGIPQLRTSTEFEDMFPADSPAVSSLRWVQTHLGSIDTLEFVIKFPDPRGDLLERLRWLGALERKLASSEDVESTFSALSFLPQLPEAAGVRGTIQRAILRRTLADRSSELVAAGFLSHVNGGESWRISARMLELRSDTFEQIRDEVLALCQSHLDTSNLETQHPSIDVTGQRSVMETAHQVLLSDLGASFLAAFVLITPVMMLIVRSTICGLILMIPNTLPVAIVFGGMGWLGIRLDVASILTASVALGIAVDDTLHFMNWFTRCRQRGDPVEAAVLGAIDTCARPMLQTTIICTGAMLPFFLSQFLPTSKFALLMILTLSGAIVGDLLLLPAILHGPLGKFFSSPKVADSLRGSGHE